MAQINFDSTTVAPQASFAPIPAGTYLAIITDSDIVPLKSGAGERLKLTFEVMDGSFKGRKIWDSLNINHPNPQAMQIAQSGLSAICHATGVTKLNDTAQLHNRPLKIRVKVRPAGGGYEESNAISGFESASGAAAPARAPAASAAPAAEKVAPWAKAATAQAA